MKTTGSSNTPKASRRLGVVITAGPTQEPIDDVRFIGNRSSGRLGIALALEAGARGHDVTLLLGPIPALEPDDFGRSLTGIRTHGKVVRFRTTEDLERGLAAHGPNADVIVMSAAVADYRPKQGTMIGKIRRADAGLSLELEPTPDLLAGLGRNRRKGQLLVGFALEPRERLLESARQKLDRKAIDLIVANPLETMDSGEIEARVLGRGGEDFSTNGRMAKTEFAKWLFEIVERAIASLSS
jgi:phosphopantothenoylcysteine decarboxylase/phosphopantothenate--cysteine ligase